MIDMEIKNLLDLDAVLYKFRNDYETALTEYLGHSEFKISNEPCDVAIFHVFVDDGGGCKKCIYCGEKPWGPPKPPSAPKPRKYSVSGVPILQIGDEK